MVQIKCIKCGRSYLNIMPRCTACGKPNPAQGILPSYTTLRGEAIYSQPYSRLKTFECEDGEMYYAEKKATTHTPIMISVLCTIPPLVMVLSELIRVAHEKGNTIWVIGLSVIICLFIILLFYLCHRYIQDLKFSRATEVLKNDFI